MIPINILLIIFLLFMVVVFVFTFFNVYHLLRFGEARKRTIVITVIYLTCVTTLLSVSSYMIMQADWSATIQILPTTHLPK
ncbi:hypothetical protein HQ524_04425 [Candidatus Uhrbacteria bacterium]|nr:hypothetical protein [Candidatus Uhrbacteria bacterium]